MNYMELGLLVLGLVLLIFGYRRNNRNVLVAAALVLLASRAIPDFVAGLQEGFVQQASLAKL